MNMGIEPFWWHFGEPICAQRLVRKICSNCRETLKVPSKHARRRIHARGARDDADLRWQGLRNLQQDGYKDAGLYEVMEISDELARIGSVGASALELKKKAMDNGMLTLRGGPDKVALA